MGRGLTSATWLFFLATMYLIFTEAVSMWVRLPDLGNIGFTLVFVVFALLHCIAIEGPAFTAQFFLISAVVSYVLEEIGVRTGLIYGAYHYSDMLGAKMGHVPVIIPLAWFMMIYPCWMVARAILRNVDMRSLAGLMTLSVIAALVITGWNMVMDPGMECRCATILAGCSRRFSSMLRPGSCGAEAKLRWRERRSSWNCRSFYLRFSRSVTLWRIAFPRRGPSPCFPWPAGSYRSGASVGWRRGSGESSVFLKFSFQIKIPAPAECPIPVAFFAAEPAVSEGEGIGKLFDSLSYNFFRRNIKAGGLREWERTKLDEKTKVVCKPCNNICMSNLEGRTRLAFSEMMRDGSGACILSRGTALLAACAFKCPVIGRPCRVRK